jgi:hypothetical protein
MLVQVSPTTNCRTAGRRKFIEELCKEHVWLTFDQNIHIAYCEMCASFPSISDQNYKIVKSLVVPFKLKAFKKHDTSFQPYKYVIANKALMALEATLLAVLLKKWVK